MSMKNSSDTIGNWTRDLPACSAVAQPTAPPRDPTFNSYLHILQYILSLYNVVQPEDDLTPTERYETNHVDFTNRSADSCACLAVKEVCTLHNQQTRRITYYRFFIHFSAIRKATVRQLISHISNSTRWARIINYCMQCYLVVRKVTVLMNNFSSF